MEQKRTADTQVASKWVVIVTLAVVVASFLGGSGYAEYRARRTHDLTAEIANNESPSISYLAAARAELRDLQRLLNTHVLQASTGQPAPTQPLVDVRDRLRENLQRYFALPAFADEKELWQRIDKELTDVDVLAGKIMEATAAGRYATAQTLLVDELPDAIDDEADAIMDDIRLNAARISEVAGMIEGERRSRTLWVFGLDGVSVALAISLAALALKTLSRQEAMVRRRQEELEGFAGRVAHDLLNPISAAEMSLAAAERGAAGNDRMTALAARGRRSLKRARSLIDDLFAFAQAGARPLPGVSTAVAETVEGVVEELRAPAAERGITIDGRAAAGAARRALRERRAGEPAVQSAAQRDQAHGQQQAPAGRRPGQRRATTASASRSRTPGRGCRRSWFRRRSTRTCAAPAPRSRVSVWAWRPCAGSPRGTMAVTACRRGRGRARCSGSSCPPPTSRRPARFRRSRRSSRARPRTEALAGDAES